MSRSCSCNSTRPGSPKIVGHGLSFEQPPPSVTIVSTSEWTTVPTSSGSAPDAPWSDMITSRAGDLPSRTNSPQPAIAADTATTPDSVNNFASFAVTVTSPLQPHDLRRNEDEQLAALIRELIAFEQPAKQRQPVQRWRPVLTRLLATDVNAADDRRLAAAHQYLRQCALRVDRRDAVDGAAEVGRRVLHRDSHDHGISGGDLRRHPQRQRGVAE